MKKLAILVLLISIVVIAGCVLPGGKDDSESDNDTEDTDEATPEPPRGVEYLTEAEATRALDDSEAAKLFLGLYTADLELKLVECCAAAIDYDFGCNACGEEIQGMWIATYTKDTRKVIIGLDAASGGEIAVNPPIEYLKNGKYCKEDADCINRGSLYSAMCINYMYNPTSGTACDGSQLGCRGSMECCGCSGNVCVKKTVPLSASNCPTSSSTNGGTSSNGGTTSGSTSVSCDSISEVADGKTITSEAKTVVVAGVYQEGTAYKVKFRVTTDDGTSSNYVGTGETSHIGGVEIHVSEIAVSMGGAGDVVSVSFSGLGSSCTIE